MTDIKISYDPETKFYDALLLSKWIATQAKSLDELIKNINESLSLYKQKECSLKKFSISFEENYVNS